MASRFVDRLIWILWVLVVAALPFTSVPLVSKLIRSTAVAPGSLLFVIPLAVIAFPLMIKRKQALPFQSKSALFFFLYVFLTVFVAFFRNVPDYKDQTILSAAVEGIATSGLGLLFLFVFMSIPNNWQKIDLTMRILNWTGLVSIVWSIITGVVPVEMRTLRHIIGVVQDYTTTTKLFEGRMTGFAAEPSWLAHMLNLVFLAYWLAATINKTSVHKFRLWKFSFENLLLIGGIVVLAGTLSRGGLAAFMLVVAFLFLLMNIRFVQRLASKWNVKRRMWGSLLLSLGLIIAYLGLLVLGLFVLSKVDPRMENVFRFNSSVENPLIKYADELQFGERVLYWQTGWNIFNEHPIFGVGVGFSGFYFPDHFPDSAWGLVETRRLLYQSTNLMNIKNFWVRLLAETGIVGFALFTTFLIVIAFTSVELIRSKTGMRRTFGYMGAFTLIALILEEFSVDSFVLPYIWFTFGLVAAAWRWYHPDIGETHG